MQVLRSSIGKRRGDQSETDAGRPAPMPGGNQRAAWESCSSVAGSSPGPDTPELYGLSLPRWGRSVDIGQPSYSACYSLKSSDFEGCTFLRGGHAERHSAVHRSPRSHSSASLRSKSALAFSSLARANLRYRTARALLMSQILNATERGIKCRKKISFLASAAPMLGGLFMLRHQSVAMPLWTTGA
jgi:hypothetical protein